MSEPAVAPLPAAGAAAPPVAAGAPALPLAASIPAVLPPVAGDDGLPATVLGAPAVVAGAPAAVLLPDCIGVPSLAHPNRQSAPNIKKVALCFISPSQTRDFLQLTAARTSAHFAITAQSTLPELLGFSPALIQARGTTFPTMSKLL
jgi:hypothetical protein